jgi:MFS transporter, putative metabolite:H+ symporter
MSSLIAEGALLRPSAATPFNATANAQLVARLERLLVTPRLTLLRLIVGIATFFDAYPCDRVRDAATRHGLEPCSG